MRNDQSGREDPEHPRVARCGHCGQPLLNRRKRAKYCSREHKELARAARKRASDRLTRLRANHPFADLPDLPEFRDLDGIAPYDDDDDQTDDERGIFTAGAGPDHDPDSAFREQMLLAETIGRIESDYERRARPYTEQQRRNPGVVRPELAALMRERDARIADLTRAQQRARALEWATREAPQRAVQAAERQTEQAALRALSRDLPGRSRWYEQPRRPGRGTADIGIW